MVVIVNNNIGSVYASLRPLRVTASAPTLRQPAGLTSDGDTVELSGVGKALSRAVEESSFTLARIRTLRAEIETGTYETAERIDGTVERLLDVVG